MTIIFTTAFKDIKRCKWDYYQRTNDTYYEDFYKLAENIKYKLVVYLEPDIKQQIIKNKNFNDNIIFMDMNNVNTFYNKYLKKDKYIIESEKYNKKIPYHRINNPEHKYSEYNMINHSKINFIKNTKNIFSGYEYYAWIDFGNLNRDIENIPKNIDFDLLVPKITYNCLNYHTYMRPDPNEMLSSDIIYFDGSSFIVHNTYVNLFHDLWEKKIIEFQEKYISDDDQNLVLQIYFDHPELFNNIYSHEFYKLYKSLQYTTKY